MMLTFYLRPKGNDWDVSLIGEVGYDIVKS